MINSIYRQLLGGGPLRPGLFLVSCLLSVLVGFVWVAPETAAFLVVSSGYYYIAAVFLAFVVCVGLRFREEWPGLKLRLQRGWPVLVILLLLCVFLGLADRLCYKVLFDEPCLQGTAMYMHKTQQVGTISAGLVNQGHFIITEMFLDKRPYFFAFLVSLLHGLLGYREGNAFLLNLLLIPVLVVSTYVVAARLTQRRGGLLAVVLLCTLPILAQCATGAGMDFHNLVMLAVSFWAAFSYLDKPEPLRLSVLCLSAVLLAQSRYESALFVLPVAMVILLGWLRAGRAVWSWVAIITPLLLVPYAWHNKYLSTIPELWQLRPGQSSRFGLEYLWDNLRGAVHFLFNFGPSLPNSPQLTLLGLASVLVLGFLWLRAVRAKDSRPQQSSRLALVFFGGAVGVNFLLLQFYYWAKLDDYLACRFSLPLYWWLCLCVPLCVAFVSVQRVWVERLVWLFVFSVTAVHTLPTLRKAEYTETNLVSKEIDWEAEQLRHINRDRLLVIANKSTIPWVVAGVSSMMLKQETAFWQRLRRDRAHGLFPEMYVTQTCRAADDGGPFELDTKEQLPDEVQLETVAELRQGRRADRLSRVVAIGEPAVLPALKP